MYFNSKFFNQHKLATGVNSNLEYNIKLSLYLHKIIQAKSTKLNHKFSIAYFSKSYFWQQLCQFMTNIMPKHNLIKLEWYRKTPRKMTPVYIWYKYEMGPCWNLSTAENNLIPRKCLISPAYYKYVVSEFV